MVRDVEEPLHERGPLALVDLSAPHLDANELNAHAVLLLAPTSASFPPGALLAHMLALVVRAVELSLQCCRVTRVRLNAASDSAGRAQGDPSATRWVRYQSERLLVDPLLDSRQRLALSVKIASPRSDDLVEVDGCAAEASVSECRCL